MGIVANMFRDDIWFVVLGECLTKLVGRVLKILQVFFCSGAILDEGIHKTPGCAVRDTFTIYVTVVGVIQRVHHSPCQVPFRLDDRVVLLARAATL